MKKAMKICCLIIISLFFVSSQVKAQDYVSVSTFYGVKESETVFSSCGYIANLHIGFYATNCTEYEVEQASSSTGPFTAIGGQSITPGAPYTFYSFSWKDYFHFCSSCYYRLKFHFIDGRYLYSNTIYVAF
jgi:hypothetical protein